MKVEIKIITHERLITPTVCDKCDTPVFWSTTLEFFDEWKFPYAEEHYLCVDHLIPLGKSVVKKEMIEI